MSSNTSGIPLKPPSINSYLFNFYWMLKIFNKTEMPCYLSVCAGGRVGMCACECGFMMMLSVLLYWLFSYSLATLDPKLAVLARLADQQAPSIHHLYPPTLKLQAYVAVPRLVCECRELNVHPYPMYSKLFFFTHWAISPGTKEASLTENSSFDSFSSCFPLSLWALSLALKLAVMTNDTLVT